jgi:hypothetical protein
MNEEICGNWSILHEEGAAIEYFFASDARFVTFHTLTVPIKSYVS